MTIAELKAISDKYERTPAGDSKFLADTSIRQIFWECIGHGVPLENGEPAGFKCSQADAAEMLREKVAEKVQQWVNCENEVENVAVYNKLLKQSHCTDRIGLLLYAPRDRFLVFAGALMNGGGA